MLTSSISAHEFVRASATSLRGKRLSASRHTGSHRRVAVAQAQHREGTRPVYIKALDALRGVVMGVSLLASKDLALPAPATAEELWAATGATVAAAEPAASAAVASAAVQLTNPVLASFQDIVVRAFSGDQAAAFQLAATTLGAPLLAALAIRKASHWGYDGNIGPEDLSIRIQRESFFIADIRADSSAGVPALRRGARGKGARVPLERLNDYLSEEVNDPKALELALVALRVKAATPAGSKVVIMGESGYKEAADIARALKKIGGRGAYVLTGGFQAWQDCGLLTSISFSVGGVEGFVLDAKETFTEAAVLTEETLTEVAGRTLEKLITADEGLRSVTAVPVPPALAAAQEAAAGAAAEAAAEAAAKEKPVIGV